MSLMMGSGPFGPGGGEFNLGSVPEHLWYVEDWPRRMRAMFAGETVLDSQRGKALYERGRFPAHYFPWRTSALICWSPPRQGDAGV